MHRSPVIPHFDYSNVIYDAMTKADANTLQVLQNQCLRICLKAQPRTTVEELHQRAKMPMLMTEELNMLATQYTEE